MEILPAAGQASLILSVSKKSSIMISFWLELTKLRLNKCACSNDARLRGSGEIDRVINTEQVVDVSPPRQVKVDLYERSRGLGLNLGISRGIFFFFHQKCRVGAIDVQGHFRSVLSRLRNTCQIFQRDLTSEKYRSEMPLGIDDAYLTLLVEKLNRKKALLLREEKTFPRTGESRDLSARPRLY
ncbi:hypothetical protein J6590_064716 [Homalodisca vitripennis]|nr:hypothetical protein J6590_064716 [Homalodisca vitripennis]